jgi:hypothetical protein
MKSTANNIKKIPASDDAERGRNLIDNADKLHRKGDLVYRPRLLLKGMFGRESTISRK